MSISKKNYSLARVDGRFKIDDIDLETFKSLPCFNPKSSLTEHLVNLLESLYSFSNVDGGLIDGIKIDTFEKYYNSLTYYYIVVSCNNTELKDYENSLQPKKEKKYILEKSADGTIKINGIDSLMFEDYFSSISILSKFERYKSYNEQTLTDMFKVIGKTYNLKRDKNEILIDNIPLNTFKSCFKESTCGLASYTAQDFKNINQEKVYQLGLTNDNELTINYWRYSTFEHNFWTYSELQAIERYKGQTQQELDNSIFIRFRKYFNLSKKGNEIFVDDIKLEKFKEYFSSHPSTNGVTKCTAKDLNNFNILTTGASNLVTGIDNKVPVVSECNSLVTGIDNTNSVDISLITGTNNLHPKTDNIVNEQTNVYREKNNIYVQFLDDCTKKDVNGKVTLAEIYNEFKLWYKSNYDKNGIPSRSIVKYELEFKLGKLTNDYWKGISMINDDLRPILSTTECVGEKGTTEYVGCVGEKGLVGATNFKSNKILKEEISHVINKTDEVIKSAKGTIIESDKILKDIQIPINNNPIKKIPSDITFDYIIENANKIIKYAQQSFDDDQVVKVSLISSLTDPDHVIAGSKAVSTFLGLLHEAQKRALENEIKGCGPYLKLKHEFKADDTDIFFLSHNQHSRVKYDNVDIVHTTFTSIKELLDNFDLPCCKTAMNMDGNVFWISLQCISSMLTGTMLIPKYFKKYDELIKFKLQ